jgi:putative oxidoreductase
VGGALLIIGLGTRLITLPMAFVMIVAILTAHLGDIGGIADLVSLKAWIYLVLFLLLSATGAGKWSLDAMCCKDDG